MLHGVEAEWRLGEELLPTTCVHPSTEEPSLASGLGQESSLLIAKASKPSPVPLGQDGT